MEFLSFSLELGYVSAGQPADLGDSHLEDATACMWGIWGSHSALLKLSTHRGAGLTRCWCCCHLCAWVTSGMPSLQPGVTAWPPPSCERGRCSKQHQYSFDAAKRSGISRHALIRVTGLSDQNSCSTPSVSTNSPGR